MRSLCLVLAVAALPAAAQTRSIELGGGAGVTFVRTMANPFSTFAMLAKPIDVRIHFGLTDRLDLGPFGTGGAYYSFVARGVQGDLGAQVRFLVTPPGARAGLRLNASLGASSQYATAGGPSCSVRLSFSGSGDSRRCTHWENETLTGREHFAFGGVAGAEAQVFVGGFFFAVGTNARTLPVDTLNVGGAGWVAVDAGLRFGGAIGF